MPRRRGARDADDPSTANLYGGSLEDNVVAVLFCKELRGYQQKSAGEALLPRAEEVE